MANIKLETGNIKSSKAGPKSKKLKVGPERKIKKKLNKRQRSIKKKLKEVKKTTKFDTELLKPVVNLKKKTKQHLEKSDPTYPCEATVSSCLLITSKKQMVKEVHDTEGKENDERSKPIFDAKKPENFSANWEKLKSIIKADDKNNRNASAVSQNKRKLIRPEFSKKKINDQQLKLSTITSEVKICSKIGTNVQSFSALSAETTTTENPLLTKESINSKTKIVALDCEMVGGGFHGEDNILARVSIVDHNGSVLYDEHVKPQEHVTDYRTRVSGIRPSDLKNAKDYSTVQKEVADILSGCLIVGHALSNDFRCLLLSPPRFMIRDTSKFRPFIKLFNGGTPGLKKLTAKLLGVEIQVGEHDSVQDAQAAMKIYMLHRKEFEEKFAKRLLNGRSKRGKAAKNFGKNVPKLVSGL